MIRFLGLDHPFFRPLSRRVFTVLALAIYAAFEVLFGSPGWAIFALCLGLICAAAFFVKSDPQD